MPTQLCESVLIFTELADDRPTSALGLMFGQGLRLELLCAVSARFLSMFLRLNKLDEYNVFFHVLDVDHGGAVGTFADVSAAVGFMQVDPVHGERLQAVAALLLLPLEF